MNKSLRASATAKQPKILKASSLSQRANTPSPAIFRSKSPTQELSINPLKSSKTSSTSTDSSNTTYQFTRKELENKLKVFIQAYSQKKLVAGSIVSPRNAIIDIQEIFFRQQFPEQKAVNKSCDLGIQRPRKNIPKQIAAERFTLNTSYDADIIVPRQKNPESFVGNPQEYEYIQRIRELEENRRIYEDKINKHTIHTSELEQKVDLLIKEYENVVVQNEKLKLKMEEKGEADTSILNTSADSLEKLAEKARLEELGMQNEDLQQTITSLESKMHTLEEQNQRLTKEVQRTQHRLSEALTLAEESEQNLHFIKELKQENNSLKSQICEKTRIIDDLLLEKQTPQQQQPCPLELQNRISEYCTQNETLNKTLENVQKELVSSQERSQDLENQITLLNQNLKDFELKAQKLDQENTQLQKQNENNLVVISSLQNQIDEHSLLEARSLSLEDLRERVVDGKDELETIPGREFIPSEIDMNIIESQDMIISRALEAKEQEITEERAKYKLQIEQYNKNLDMLVNKIQMLVKINENLAKDVEYDRYEYTNYRASVWSVYQEAKRCLDIVKRSDTGLESYFAIGKDDLQKDFDILLNTYYTVRKEAMKIDQMMEERKLYL